MIDVTSHMLNMALDLAKVIQARAVLIYADCLHDFTALTRLDSTVRPILVQKDGAGSECAHELALDTLRVPKIELDRVGRVKIAVITALSQGLLEMGDILICLTGPKESHTVDTIMVVEVGEEFELLTPVKTSEFSQDLQAAIFESLLFLAIELANEGREGKPVGTIFVLGDHEEVLRLSRQLIFNPFEGHPEEKRSIFHPETRETIKELSSIDGAFVISKSGIVIAGGRYLNVASKHEEFPQGWGARHAAAAAITEVTKATAIVISESTGTVTIFKNGKIFMSIEKPTMKGGSTAKKEEVTSGRITAASSKENYSSEVAREGE